MIPGLFILIFIAGCTFNRPNSSEGLLAPKDISGLWFYVGGDSSYREVFYTDSCLWSYDEGGGPRFYRIKITLSDTIKLYDRDELFGESKIELVGKNEMVLSNDLETTTFFKVDKDLFNDDEMKKLLIGDTAKIEMFIDRFRAREDEWKITSKKK